MAIQSAPQNLQKVQQDKAVSPGKQSGGVSAFDLGGDIQRAAFDLARAQPNDILQLQRTVGNRAVAAMIQQHTQTTTVQPKLMVGPADDRYEREADQTAKQIMRMQTPVTMRRRDDEESAQRQTIQRSAKSSADGFAADKNFTRQLNASKSGGKSLPNETRSFMEGRFNADFSGVRIHTGDSAAQLNHDIQAKAFTHGSNIYFNQGAYAPGSGSGKELLAHELTHVVQQGAAVQRAPDGKTPKIQRKHDGLIQRSLGSWLKSKFSKKKESNKDSGDSGAPVTTTPTTTAPTNAPTSDEMRDDAAVFERNLGRVAFNHSKANSAAKTMMDKMTGVLIGDLEEDNAEQEKQLANTYGSDKVSSAGQVGKNVKAVLGVLKEGNLRERLTALMNAMFGPFKQYVLQAMKDSAWGEMKTKGLNVKKLKRRKRQLRFNLGAKDLFRDPGNPLDRKNFSTFQHTGKTRWAKEETSQRTVGELGQGNYSIGLSEREKELQFPGKKDDEIANEKLKWMEGGTYWAINHKNKWVKKVENSLHMPVVAGPSGTLLRMFQTWEYLNKPVPAADWRLAVLGWMLSSNDHSFHEMMLTATDFGLPYTPGPMAYMNIAPLSLMELRQYVAEGGLFPHEHAMMRKVQSGNIKHLMEEDDLKSGNKAVKRLDDDERGALSGPGAAAIDLYTAFGYLVLNPTRKGGKFAKMQITRNAKKKDEMSHLKDDFDQGKLTAEDLMKEAKEIIPVLDTALETLPDWSGELFRGTGTFTPFSYRKGATVKFGAYTSSTLDEDVAKEFADDYNIGPFKYILHLNTTAGKDVRDLSAANEDEILIPPGSVFKVTKRVPPNKGRAYYHVYLDQTARGGMGLKLTPDKDSKITENIKVEDVPEKTALPPVLYEIKLKQPMDANTAEGKSLGAIRAGETIGVTGNKITIPRDTLVQYTYNGDIYWLYESWWPMYFEAKYPDPGNADVVKAESSGDKGESSVDKDDSVGSVPKLDKLTLYDSNDTAIDSLSNPSDINMDDVSFMTDDTGVEWTEISTIVGELFWTKTAELMAFQGKEYKPKSSSGVTPSSSGVDSSPSTTSVSSTPVVEKGKESNVSKQKTLTLYDSNDQAVDTLDDTSQIMEDNSSSYTDDKGIEWVEIVTTGAGFYWTKAAELAAFLGKPYKAK